MAFILIYLFVRNLFLWYWTYCQILAHNICKDQNVCMHLPKFSFDKTFAMHCNDINSNGIKMEWIIMEWTIMEWFKYNGIGKNNRDV